MRLSVYYPIVLLGIFSYILFCGCSLFGQDDEARLLMWYNVENFFDCLDDPVKTDDEFTPDGARRWTATRYRRKLAGIAKVIVAAGRGDPPALVGLAEVENAGVLEDLVSHPILKPYAYSYIHFEGAGTRSLELACLFRGERLHILDRGSLVPGKDSTSGRDFLHLCMQWAEGDTLDLVLVHLVSKYRGAGASATLRRAQSLQLFMYLDSISRVRCPGLGKGISSNGINGKGSSNGIIQDGERRRDEWSLVVAGDFNEEYGAWSLAGLEHVFSNGDSMQPVKMVGEYSTYKYRGNWTAIDRFLICNGGRASEAYSYCPVPDALLCRDEKYGGLKPLRCYEGFSYSGGVSDHLPLLMSWFPAE